MSGQGDQIEGNVGDDADSVAVGKNIKQDKTTATGNVVHVNVPWHPDKSHGQDERGLSMSAEADLRNDIRELRSIIQHLSVTVSSLDKTLAVEVLAAKERIDRIEEMFTQYRQPWLSRPILLVATASAIVGCVLLGYIAYLLSSFGGV